MGVFYKFSVFVFVLVNIQLGYGQTYVTNSPDSVCVGAQNVLYRIPPPGGVSPTTYIWSITGTGVMTIQAPPVNDSILVNWPNTVGVDTVKVYQSNGGSCVGPTAALPVVRYQPTATLGGATATICAGNGLNGNYTVTFTGRAPFSATFQFSDGTNTIGPFTVNNIMTNTYTINIPPIPVPGTYTGTVIAASDRTCPITPTGTATLNVIAQPGLPVIQHID